MAIVAQVHLARQQYANSLATLDRSTAIWEADRRIAEHTAHRAEVALYSDLDRVANQTTAILSQLRRYDALAQAHAAEARLQATVGVDFEIDSVDGLSLAQLASEVAAIRNVWETMNTSVGER